MNIWGIIAAFHKPIFIQIELHSFFDYLHLHLNTSLIKYQRIMAKFTKGRFVVHKLRSKITFSKNIEDWLRKDHVVLDHQ